MHGRHAALLAPVRELLVLGTPALEVLLDHVAFGAGASKREACSVCVTFALEMGDLAAQFLGKRITELFAATRDESIGLRKLRARRSRRKQGIAGDNICTNCVASGLRSRLCRVEPCLRRLRVTDGRRKLTDACSLGANAHISHGSEPVVGHSAMLH